MNGLAEHEIDFRNAERGSWPATKKAIVEQERHRPAQEGPGEHANSRQNHRLEPDPQQPLHEVLTEVARVGQEIEIALAIPRYWVGLMQSTVTLSEPREPTRYDDGRFRLLV